MGKTKLRPCPFCGGKPKRMPGWPMAMVVCQNKLIDCGARVMAPTQSDADYKWNLRAQEPPDA